MSVSTGDSLMRQCVLVLDAIYSHFNCVEYITTLQRIEANLFNNAYKNFDDFQNEDSIHNFITLFFDVETNQSDENPDISYIKASVATVHPLGELHTTTLDTFEGWIKVKIAHSKTIYSIIPTALAERLFEKKEQMPRKISIKSTTDLITARQNELTRQFLIHITGSRVKEIEPCYHINLNNLLESSPNEYTPSSSNMPNSIPSDKLIKQSSVPANTQLGKKETVNTLSTTEINATLQTQDNISEPKKPVFKKHWRRLEKFACEKNVDVVPMSKYGSYIKRNTDAEGYFKHVYFTTDKVIQVFRRSTAAQRVIEIASLLALKGKNHIGCIKELIYDETTEEIIGLTMERYNMTLKQYLKLHSRHRLSAKQRMHIIIQMLKSMCESHRLGIAHRDLSSVNFMIDTNNMDDEPHLYLIDFGKAVFYSPAAAKRWWVLSDDANLYLDEVNPSSKEELAIWCKNLPYVMARPDHGYRFYRSIQTLPRANKDHKLLPYLIDPAAEDVYSLGNIVWKICLDIEPWPGIFDTDLKKLRETVGRNDNIDRVLDQTMPGPYSKLFLQKFLRALPQDRKSAAEILLWLEQPDIQTALIAEWSLEGGSRKVVHKTVEATVTKPVKTANSTKQKAKPLTDQEPNKLSVKNTKQAKATSIVVKGIQSIKPTKKSEVKYTFKDGIKCYAKSGIPTGRPPRTPLSRTTIEDDTQISNPSHPYVKTGKPRGRPKKPEFPVINTRPPKRSAPVDDDSDDSGLSKGIKHASKVIKQDEPKPTEVVQIDVPDNVHSFNPLPPTLCMSSSSRPPSLSPQYVHPVQLDGSQSTTCLSMSPVSHVDPTEQLVTSAGWSPEIGSKKRKAVEISGDPGVSQADDGDKLKKQCLAVTDEFDRALYNILQSLGLDSV
ncbi:hypothetical protein HPULCUR_001684 [Helicostylum pulchrum]|uniref:Protein kinase domain-containing protein n=1 Tax=Helicostylum pulchrum TaxID=562976 RepID=A0ABP9XNE5_9FUNG